MSEKYSFPLITASKRRAFVDVSRVFLDWIIRQDEENKQGLFSEKWNQMESHDRLHVQLMFDGL